MVNRKICYSLSTVACVAIIWLASVQFFSLEILTFSTSNRDKDVEIVDARDDDPFEDNLELAREGPLIFTKQRLWTVGKDITFHVSLTTLGPNFSGNVTELLSVKGPSQPQILLVAKNSTRLTYKYQASVAGLYFVTLHVTEVQNEKRPHGVTIFQKVLYSEQVVSGKARASIAKFMAHVHEMQYPKDCSTARLYYYQLGGRMDYGIGVHTEYMVASFARAMEQNRTFVVPTKAWDSELFFYWARKRCASKSWFCYFHPMSSCSEDHLGVRSRYRLPKDDGNNDHQRAVLGAPCPRKKSLAAISVSKLAERFAPYSVAGSFLRFRGAGRYQTHDKCQDGLKQSGKCIGTAQWVAAYLTEYVLRPLPWVLDAIDDQMSTKGIEWKHPVGTVHVRRTDKIKGKLKEAKDPLHTYDLKNYFDAIERVEKRVKFPSSFQRFKKRLPQVYVATDTQKVIAEMEARFSSPEKRNLMYDAAQKRYEMGTILQLRTRRGSVDENQEAVNALKDIWLLSQGHWFVGTRSSFFGRTSFLLMYAGGRAFDFEFLDNDPWGRFPVGRSLCY